MKDQSPAAAKVNSQIFLAVLWSGTGISLCFLIFRILVRIKSFRRIYADDLLVLVAWLMLLISAVIWQTQQTAMYRQFAISAGTIIPTPEMLKAERKLLHTELAVIVMYFTSLWIIKLSFLVFFRRLGQKVKGQKIWWWCVLLFTIGTWGLCIGVINFDCLVRPLDYIEAECDRPPALRNVFIFQILSCVVDVISDVAIITIPVRMLWNVRISWRRKLALMVIFSLTIIVTVVSIVRIALISSKNKTEDISWLYMWSNVEMITSTIVACLASFRQLFIKSENSGHIQEGSYLPLWTKNLLATLRSSKPASFLVSGNSYTRPNFRRGIPSTHDSTEQIVSLDTVHIGHKASVSSYSVDHAI